MQREKRKLVKGGLMRERERGKGRMQRGRRKLVKGGKKSERVKRGNGKLKDAQ